MPQEIQLGVKGTVELNTQNAEQQLDNLKNQAENGSITSLSGDKAYNNMNDFNGTLVSLNDAMKGVISNFKVFSEQLKNGTSGGFGNSADVSGDNSIFKKALAGNGLSRAISGVGMAATFYDANERAKQQMLMGDWLGADVSRTRAIGSGMSALGSTMMGLTMIPGVGPVLGLTGAAFALGGMGVNAYASHKETQKTAAELYADTFDVKDSLLRSFGDRPANQRNSYEVNQARADDIYRKIVGSNVNLNMTDNEFASLVSGLSRSGIRDVDLATDYITRAGMISRTTGVDASSVANIMGTVTRYGGNGLESMNYAFGNARRAGFDDTQFDELLMGIENAMEDGISKGFIVSSKDLIDTVTMLRSTSGDSAFWSGKEGLNRLQTLRSGMASAMDLNSVNDSLLWQAVSSTVSDEDMKNALQGGYIEGNNISNVRAYLEQGNMTDDVLKAYVKNLQGRYGNNADAITSALMGMGFSQNEANQFYNQMNGINAYDTSVKINSEREGGMQTGSTESMNVKNALNRDSTLNTDNLKVLLSDITYKVRLDSDKSVSEKTGVEGVGVNGWSMNQNILESEALNGTQEEMSANMMGRELNVFEKITPEQLAEYYSDVAGTATGTNPTDGIVFDPKALMDVVQKWSDILDKMGADRIALYEAVQ